MSLQEETEYKMIEERIRFNELRGRWTAEYPWIKSPMELADNRRVALATLGSIEKRLMKNPDHREIYSSQIKDMLDRKVARQVTEEELNRYAGPKFYLSHHAVVKPESKSTPCRIVFNSSAKYMGLSLNECLAKGPSLLNVLLGVLLRFRQDKVGFMGDVKKMYHSIDIPIEDQMTHLFLWRDCNTDAKPNTYAITAVNMGDRPSATIAQIALRKTADSAADTFPESSHIIKRNAYMDDIPGSVNDREEAKIRMQEIDKILGDKGFIIKEWIFNDTESDQPEDQERELPVGIEDNSETEGVLGMKWEIKEDLLCYRVNLTHGMLDEKKESTKRNLLSVTNSIYDPLGLLTPFTTKAKIVIRSVWAHEPKLDWDTPLPEQIRKDWSEVKSKIPDLVKLKFPRALKPMIAIGKPILIIFSDGSEHAYGAVAYLRWELENGSYDVRLIMAKSRMAPLKTVDIVRIELSGAVMSTRLRATIQKEMQIQFDRVIHLVDSEIVHAMIHRQSYGFNTYVANRVGEIHQSTDSSEWAWLPGKMNVADITTRGSHPDDLESESDWQKGQQFLTTVLQEWPIRFEVNKSVSLPETKETRNQKEGFTNFVGIAHMQETLADRIDASRFSNWRRLQYVTARIIRLYKRFRRDEERQHVGRDIDSQDLRMAEEFWIKDAQKSLDKGKCIKLRPESKDGILVVGGRTERWLGCTWNQQQFVLLPKDSQISRLIARYEHQSGGHLGLAASISKVRSKYWIIGIRTMMKDIIRKCRHCKEKLKAMHGQAMSPLPIERIQPSPPFMFVGIDYFGPYAVKGEVQKRVRGKAYGTVITCFSSRAVYVDVAHDLSTDGFLQVLRRFATMRGWPRKIYSDKGTQFVRASNELKSIIAGLDWDEIKRFCLYPTRGTEWKFAPPDGQWFNGVTESMVKSVKRALNAAIGVNVLQFSELQTCLFEAAELVNERPIGPHPSSPEEGIYLSPNDLILGRSTARIPQGKFKERTSDKHRFDFIQMIVDSFWKRWMQEVYPNMVIEPKWHTERRNLRAGDIVLIQDANPVRGHWKMGRIENAIDSADKRVRRVLVSYANEDGTRITVERPVQRLIVIVPNSN